MWEEQRNMNNKMETKISIKDLSILYLPHLVYSNNDVLILNFDGFIAEIVESREANFICTVTLNYFSLGKNVKKVYYIQSILQLNKWLQCMRGHSKKMFIIGYCKEFKRVPDSLNAEITYILERLDAIAVHD